MLLDTMNQTVTVTSPGTRTVRGSSLPDWDNPVSVTVVGGCSVQPAGTSLDESGRWATMDGLTAYLPYTADVKAGDRVTFDGLDYAIEGEPRKWASPTGAVAHIFLNLKRWEG